MSHARPPKDVPLVEAGEQGLSAAELEVIELRNRLNAAVAAEREACARAVLTMKFVFPLGGDPVALLQQAAARIRERGGP